MTNDGSGQFQARLTSKLAEEEPVNDMDHIVKEFLIENSENLDQLDRDLEPSDSSAAAAADAPPASEATRSGIESRCGVSEGNIRVHVGLLDKLMNLVGELVLARNQVLRFNAAQKDTAFVSTSQRLNLITTELQEGAVKTRMQPINSVDHGIEAPAVRPERGKPPKGRRLLRADYDGGQVNIEIADDAGIDPQRIKQKGLDRG